MGAFNVVSALTLVGAFAAVPDRFLFFDGLQLSMRYFCALLRLTFLIWQILLYIFRSSSEACWFSGFLAS
ncbi:hypothetical protein BJ165DRAFT_1452349 [Panaeolus papilionaceus]|nr:hypothetical protein BJ165DRAFT_1452349 [Panaeolus papilionaceus]